MTKIWARRSSSAAQKVFWTLAELGIPHEQINAGAAYGVVDDPEYRRKNPNGLVPTLEEPDGFVLWESHAIVRYLALREGTSRLAPSNARQRARADSFMDWTSNTLQPPVGALWVRRVLHRELPYQPPDDALIASAAQALTILSRELSPERFLLGNELSIGDIPLGVMVHRWFTLPIERPELPRVRAYYDALLTRAAYREHVVAPPPLV